MILDDLVHPLMLAPLAGGPSTPELTAAVAGTGAFAFLAAGYLAADALDQRIAATRALTDRPFGVNVFVPGTPADPVDVQRYAREIGADAAAAGAGLGEARFEDDAYPAKIDVLCAARVPVVSFTFGLPAPDVVARLHATGAEVWVTVTGPDDAVAAQRCGADALLVQGAEAGGHRGGPSDDGPLISLLPLLQLVRARTDLPLVAAGGLATGPAVAAALVAGARCAAVGSAFLRCPEAGTSEVHRAALAAGTAATATTRAFTGRTARGLVNRFLVEHSAAAPRAYPEVHHLTAPLRQAGRAAGDPDVVNLWAGESYPLVDDAPAAQVVARLARDARAALAATAARWAD